MTDLPLSGRRALVTGASSGIGAATAQALRQAGARVAVGARRVERLDGDFVQALDLTDRASTESFVEAAVASLGGLEILVNNAGLALGKQPFSESTEEDENVQVDTNLSAVLRMTRLCLPHLADGGHIVNIGSFFGRVAGENTAVYSATKFAVRGFSYALREDLLGRPIRVTVIDPGVVQTEAPLVLHRGDAKLAAAPYVGIEPLAAEDLARCVLFAVTQPPHVNIDEIVVKPTAQSTRRIHRADS